MGHAKLARRLQDYMDALAAHGYFHGAVLVEYRGEVLLKEGYGFASYQYDVPNTVSTRFRIGSLTKAFTAMAVLKLHEQGKLDIQETVEHLLPAFKNGHLITVHQLLTHTSGVPDFASAPDYWGKSMRLPADLHGMIGSFLDLPLDFAPGTSMRYSNSGYLLLTAIIEKVSGIAYAEFVQHEILDVLGLTDTGIEDGRTIVKHLATGHTVWGDIRHTEFIDMSFPLGAYGMYATVEDLCTWSRALRESRLIDPLLQKQMFTSHDHGFGYGWFVEEERADHFGDVNGFANHMMMHLDEELTVIVLSNLNLTPVIGLSRQLADMVLERQVQELQAFTPLPDVLMPDLAGIYTNGSMEVKVGWDHGLYAVVPKMYNVPYKLPLMLVCANARIRTYKSRFVPDTVLFHLDEHGAPCSLEWVNAYSIKYIYTKMS